MKTTYLLGAVTTAAGLALGATAVAPAATTSPHDLIPHDLLLPTGDHVLAVGDQFVLTPRPGVGYFREKINGDTYIIPTDAKGDPARYDVSALTRGAAPAPQAAQPNYPMHTLALTVLGADGKPAAANLVLINLDSERQYGDFPSTADGELRISVPNGHYGLTAYVPGMAGDKLTDLRVLNRGDIVVAGDQAITLDARAATAPVSVQTPRPADLTDLAVHTMWTDAKKASAENSFLAPNVPVLLEPAPAPAIGQRLTFLTAHLDSPAGQADPYTYDVVFREAGAIPADQHQVVAADQLQTVHANYFGSLHAGFARELWSVGLDLPATAIHPITTPLRRTEYVGGASDLIAKDYLFTDATKQTGVVYDGPRLVKPGATRTADWLREPLAPGLVQPTDAITDQSTPAAAGWGWGCAACRTGDTLGIGVLPAADSDPGHALSLDDKDITSAHLVLSGNGKVYADVRSTDTGRVTLPAASAVYHLTLDATMHPQWLAHSTTSHTEWTFASGRSDTRTVPANWGCESIGDVAQCSALPLLDVRYAKEDKGATISFAHAPGGSTSPITKAGAEISYDGKNWLPAPLVSLGNGKYRALWLGKPAALRVSATDAAGNSLQQTVSY
ncbi:hypothetical protein [Kutzneria sp. NPDC051319]|uniref:hypothetical protein n=1 Tax=Kutzneria sp. NPDC051319 TaxID=3155047 RepID=UPI00341E2B02